MSICAAAAAPGDPHSLCCSPHQSQGTEGTRPRPTNQPPTPGRMPPKIRRVRFPSGMAESPPRVDPVVQGPIRSCSTTSAVESIDPSRSDVVEGQNKAAAPHAHLSPRSRRHIDAEDAARRSVPVWIMCFCRGVWGCRKGGGCGREGSAEQGGRCALFTQGER